MVKALKDAFAAAYGSIEDGAVVKVTGVIDTPDQRTMFVNIQHPGDNTVSTWPRLDGLSLPRSATVIITKNDGGVIGT